MMLARRVPCRCRECRFFGSCDMDVLYRISWPMATAFDYFGILVV